MVNKLSTVVESTIQTPTTPTNERLMSAAAAKTTTTTSSSSSSANDDGRPSTNQSLSIDDADNCLNFEDYFDPVGAASATAAAAAASGASRRTSGGSVKFAAANACSSSFDGSASDRRQIFKSRLFVNSLSLSLFLSQRLFYS